MFTSQTWGVGATGDTTYGTGTSPTDFTASDGLTLLWSGTGDDGRDYIASAQIRYAAGSASALDDKTYTVDVGDETYDVSGFFTITNLTGSWAVTAITGVSISSSGVITVDTATAAVQSGTMCTVTFTDQYGRKVIGSFSLSLQALGVSISGGLVVLDYGEDTKSDAELPVTLTGGEYDGETFTVTPGQIAALGDGKGINKIAPVVAFTSDADSDGAVDSGDVLGVSRAGLWVYDGAYSPPTITRDWRDGAGSLSDTDMSYTSAGGETTSVYNRETDGTTTADSNAISVDGGGGYADIAAVVADSSSDAFYAETDDSSALWQDTGASTAVTTTGDPVARVDRTAGTINPTQPTSGNRPTWTSASGLLQLNSASNTRLQLPFTTRGSSMYFAAVVSLADVSANDRFAFLGGASSHYVGLGAKTSTSTVLSSNAGTPGLLIDGQSMAALSIVDRDDLITYLRDGAKHVVEAYAMDLTAAGWATLYVTFLPSNSSSALTGDYVLCDDQGVDARTVVRTELATKHSITLP